MDWKRLVGFELTQAVQGWSNSVPLNGGYVARLNAADPRRRAAWDESLNFKLPASWLSGYTYLQLEVPGLHRQPLLVSFQPGLRLPLKIINVHCRDADGRFHGPRPNDVAAELQRAADLFPVSRDALKHWLAEPPWTFIWSGADPSCNADPLVQLLNELLLCRSYSKDRHFSESTRPSGIRCAKLHGHHFPPFGMV